jgi:hypothetical protein
LRLIQHLPISTTLIGSCTSLSGASVQLGVCSFHPIPTTSHSQDQTLQCSNLCAAVSACTGFSLSATSSTTSSCCLASSFVVDTYYTAANADFYSMPQCTVCDAGYFKLGRICQAFSQPPVFLNQSSSYNLVIPLSLPANSSLLTLFARAETGYGPVRYSLSQIQNVFSIDRHGVVRLAVNLTLAGTYSATITAQDSRSVCYLQDATSGNVDMVSGGCTSTAITVTIKTAVFLNCPAAIIAYVSSNTATNTTVSWTTPRLPSFLSSVAVNANLADALTTTDPYTFSFGTRQITYTSAPLSVGGSIQCSFQVQVVYGFSLAVTSFATLSQSRLVEQFFVADGQTADASATLPHVPGWHAGQRSLYIGIQSPATHPFVITPAVREEGGTASGGKPLNSTRPLPPSHHKPNPLDWAAGENEPRLFLVHSRPDATLAAAGG